ncbi:hypothetical protein ACFQ2B_19335 [Streptomyces stramineus]
MSASQRSGQRPRSASSGSGAVAGVPSVTVTVPRLRGVQSPSPAAGRLVTSKAQLSPGSTG